MKTFFVIIQVVTMSILLVSAHSNAKSTSTSRLSTDIRFNGTTVNGKRHIPFGMSTTVEAEKNIPKLIDYRSNFNDRIARSKTGR